MEMNGVPSSRLSSVFSYESRAPRAAPRRTVRTARSGAAGARGTITREWRVSRAGRRNTPPRA